MPIAPPCQGAEHAGFMTAAETNVKKTPRTVQQAYLKRDIFKVEARQFDNVSQSEYRTQRSFVWMIKAFANVLRIYTLDQVTPENEI